MRSKVQKEERETVRGRPPDNHSDYCPIQAGSEGWRNRKKCTTQDQTVRSHQVVSEKPQRSIQTTVTQGFGSQFKDSAEKKGKLLGSHHADRCTESEYEEREDKGASQFA